MSKKSTAVLLQAQETLTHIGEQIHLAWLRWHLSAELLADQFGISQVTLSNIERKLCCCVAHTEWYG